MVARFWWSWPSWLVELIAGLVLASLVQVVPSIFWQLAAALFLSWVYETFLDPNAGVAGHNPGLDMYQRAAGIVLGVALWGLL